MISAAGPCSASDRTSWWLLQETALARTSLQDLGSKKEIKHSKDINSCKSIILNAAILSCNIMETDSASWEVGAFGSEDLCSSGMQLQWPPSSYSCSFCHREFRTAQALGGHMNVHRRERAAHKNAGQRETSSALAHQPLLAPVLTTDRRRRAAGPHKLHRDPAAPSCSDDPPQLLLTSSQLVDFFSHGSLANRGSNYNNNNTTAAISSPCTDHYMSSSFELLSQETSISSNSAASSLSLQQSFSSHDTQARDQFFPDSTAAAAGAAGNASCRSLTLVQASEHHHHHQRHHHHHQLPIKSLDLELRLGHS
ncbi:hypothetical protein CY35_17G077900 [Sphagnum magellanicum]|jgi:hypothetical protein|nr:hypothetical protein CY35_17G077900 [Sphagnum magellanicum]